MQATGPNPDTWMSVPEAPSFMIAWSPCALMVTVSTPPASWAQVVAAVAEPGVVTIAARAAARTRVVRMRVTAVLLIG